MQSQHFAKHRLAQAVSIAVGVSLTSPIVAQDSVGDEPMIEEVLVTGIRSSLKRAMDTKRDSQGVVDAITAEDIGDFPDTNLAEALQRITGVAIDRHAGDALQCFSEVGIREVADVFSCNRVHNALRVAFRIHGAFQA